MSTVRCFFGCEDPVVRSWHIYQPENRAKLGVQLYFCEYHGLKLDKFAENECDGKFDDNTIIPFIEKYTVDKKTGNETCAACMFPATGFKWDNHWCLEHGRLARQVAAWSPTPKILTAVQEFLHKMQTECEDCGEDTDRCKECASCRCEECAHFCVDCHKVSPDFYTCDGCDNTWCEWCQPDWCAACSTCSDCCSTCRRCGECEHSHHCECGNESESDVALEDWGLPPDFKLHRAAAIFYTLATMAERDEIYRPDFEYYAQELADVFAPYLDMAVGGEIRYGSSTIGDGEAKRLMPRIHKAYGRWSGGLNRGKAWAEWKKLREEYGTDILIEAEYALREGKWGRSVGGEAWAQVAATLRQYEEKEISVITFVDTAFGLEHNNGCIFNKLWTTKGLQDILNANLSGEIEYVEEHLPEEEPHTKRYRAWKHFGSHTFR